MACELIAAVVFVVVLLLLVTSLLQGRSSQSEPIYVINGFYMSMREKYTAATASLYYFVVEWDAKDLSWSDFREKVLGATDPATAESGSLRRTIYDDYQSLGLAEQPNVGDNGMHGSASPFEAMAERLNWLHATLEKDQFARALSARDIPKKTIAEWTKDPQVMVEGTKGSLFDALEDMNAEACIKKCLKINGSRAKPPSYPKNEAFVFIKPHAVTDKVKALVEECFKSKGISIVKEDTLDGTTIGEEKLIDNHYYAIANKASLSKPKELNPPAAKQDEFKEVFGLSWTDALKRNKVFNAVDGCSRMAVSGDEMDALWAKAKKAKQLVKFGGGFYAGLITPEVAKE